MKKEEQIKQKVSLVTDGEIVCLDVTFQIPLYSKSHSSVKQLDHYAKELLVVAKEGAFGIPLNRNKLLRAWTNALTKVL